MAAGFTGDAEIGACFAPLRTMRGNPLFAGAVHRKKVREFMAQSPVHLLRSDFRKRRMQQDATPCVAGHAGCGNKPRGPVHPDFSREFRRGGRSKQAVGKVLEQRVLPALDVSIPGH